jgi:hypothetical protein
MAPVRGTSGLGRISCRASSGTSENYAGVMPFSLAYIWSAQEFLKGRVSYK